VLCGPTWFQKQAPLLQQAGLSRRDVFMTNVLDYQPDAIDRVPRHEMESAFERLRSKIDALPGPDGRGPRVIVPNGNYALYGLTGKGKVSWHQKDGRYHRPGIQSWRGSILSYVGARGVTKLIPTVHPATAFKQPFWTRAGELDWQRIAEDSKFYELRLPQREHRINATVDMVRDFVCEFLRRRSQPERYSNLRLSVDIETPFKREFQKIVIELKTGRCSACGQTRKKGHPNASCDSWIAPTKEKWKVLGKRAHLGMIGFAFDPSLSLTICLADYWKNPRERMIVYSLIRTLLACDVPKVGVNCWSFDCFWLAWMGWPVVNWKWDLRAMHHCIDPVDKHSLEYMASFAPCRQPYWKDEAKDPKEVEKYAGNSDAFQTYNGIDSCVPLELQETYEERLRSEGRLEGPHGYLQKYAAVYEPLLDIALRGLRVDEARRASLQVEFAEKLTHLRWWIRYSAGRDLFGKTGISTAKLKTYLYDDLKLPKQYTKNPKDKSGARKVTTDEAALRKLMERFSGAVGDVGALILMHRGTMMQSQLVNPALLSADGRMRCVYSQFTEVMRLSSQETPIGEGRNLQNIDRTMRDLFLPDQDAVAA
jgi:uracil-DNA glycosylase family 4